MSPDMKAQSQVQPGWRRLFSLAACAGAMVATTACGVAEDDDSQDGEPDPAVTSDEQALVTSSAIQHVFVIAMENNSASTIYGNTTDCLYINNTLMKTYAYSGPDARP